MQTELLPRVTVERETSWLRVQANADAALSQALEARLSTLPGGSRGKTAARVRPALEAQLDAVRQRMWELSKPNLRVNGFNYEDYVETTEPFDETLDRSLWALNAERVHWETKVVDKRRVKASEVANLLDDLEMRRDAATWRPGEEGEGEAEAATTAGVVQPDQPPPPRHQQVVDTFGAVVENMSALVETAPVQLQRAARVHVVQEEIARLPS